MIRMMCVCANLVQSCLTLCDAMDCSLPGSSVHGSFQARILGWVVMPSSRASSWSRDWNCFSCYPALQADSILLSHLGSPIRIMTLPQNISSLGYSPKYIYIERYFCCYCLATKSCLTLCNPMDCSLLGSSVLGIIQARICRRPGFDLWVGKIPWRAWHPLQYSYLENPMDRCAWRATIYRVVKSCTQLNS